MARRFIRGHLRTSLRSLIALVASAGAASACQDTPVSDRPTFEDFLDAHTALCDHYLSCELIDPEETDNCPEAGAEYYSKQNDRCAAKVLPYAHCLAMADCIEFRGGPPFSCLAEHDAARANCPDSTML